MVCGNDGVCLFVEFFLFVCGFLLGGGGGGSGWGQCH